MKKRVGILLVLFTAAFLVAVSFNPASANKTKASHGYDIRLSSVKIELSFPDGSILYAPRDFDGKSLDKLSATGGEAQELLDIAYKQLGIVKPAELPKAFALTQNH
ncbi:MAG: hypothetical protein U9N45_05795, partial [Gemmatimonadota bacterium]|nr:hypothetical protein [Gemmatimonadota bacterium]